MTKHRKAYLREITQSEGQIREDIEGLKKEISTYKKGPLGKLEREQLRCCKSKLKEVFKSLPMNVIYRGDSKNPVCCRCKESVHVPKRKIIGVSKLDEYSFICRKCGQILRFIRYSEVSNNRRVSTVSVKKAFKSAPKKSYKMVVGFKPNKVSTVSYICGECKSHCNSFDSECKNCGVKFVGMRYLVNKEDLHVLCGEEVKENELNLRFAKFITKRTTKNMVCPNCNYNIPEEVAKINPRCCPQCGQRLIHSDTPQESKDLLFVLSKDVDKGLYIAGDADNLGVKAITYYCSELDGYTTDVACERWCSEYGNCPVVAEYLDSLKDL